MKKLLISGSITALLLPALTFASYDDVRLTTDVVLSVNGITLNISGSQATIESIAVDSTDFNVVIESGSVFQVTAPNLNQLTANTGQGQNVNTCTGSSSILGYNLVGTTDTVTVTITPGSALCADPTSSSASSASSKSDARGGGGGGTTVVAPVTPVVVPVVGTNAEAIAAIKTSLISLIQQLIILLNQEIQNMQASGTY